MSSAGKERLCRACRIVYWFLTFHSDPREGNWVVRLISASLASNFASRLVVVALVVAFSLQRESRGAKGIEGAPNHHPD